MSAAKADGMPALAGIGFTMSLLIAGRSFPDAADFAAAKIGVFLASLLAGVVGTAILWRRRTEPGSLEADRFAAAAD